MGFLPDRSEVVLRHILERQAQEIPTKDCMFFEDGERWSYGEALQEAYRAANALYEFGIKRGENVLTFLPNGQACIRAWFGIAFLGVVRVPINLAYKGEMLRYVCQDSQARHIITSPDLAERLKGLGLDLTIIDSSMLAQDSGDEPRLDRPIEPWDIHMILYTSGTTGPSKGVISHYYNTYQGSYELISRWATPQDTILVDNPLFHISGISHCYGLWMRGGQVAVRTMFTASRYLEVARECGATMSVMIGTVPAFMAAMPPKPFRY